MSFDQFVCPCDHQHNSDSTPGSYLVPPSSWSIPFAAPLVSIPLLSKVYSFLLLSNMSTQWDKFPCSLTVHEHLFLQYFSPVHFSSSLLITKEPESFAWTSVVSQPPPEPLQRILHSVGRVIFRVANLITHPGIKSKLCILAGLVLPGPPSSFLPLPPVLWLLCPMAHCPSVPKPTWSLSDLPVSTYNSPFNLCLNLISSGKPF